MLIGPASLSIRGDDVRGATKHTGPPWPAARRQGVCGFAAFAGDTGSTRPHLFTAGCHRSLLVPPAKSPSSRGFPVVPHGDTFSTTSELPYVPKVARAICRGLVAPCQRRPPDTPARHIYSARTLQKHHSAHIRVVSFINPPSLSARSRSRPPETAVLAPTPSVLPLGACPSTHRYDESTQRPRTNSLRVNQLHSKGGARAVSHTHRGPFACRPPGTPRDPQGPPGTPRDPQGTPRDSLPSPQKRPRVAMVFS